MDFDLVQVRSFVAVAEQLHFGRAAALLHLTQQALSRRIQQLEKYLGQALFIRDSRSVALTAAGQRFLPHAQHLLAVAAQAAAEARSGTQPLRVDVWGQIHPPLRWVRQLAAVVPELVGEASMRRSLPAAMAALLGNDIDVAFGRVHDLGLPWPQSLRRRLIQLDTLGAAVSLAHPLADQPVVSPADLAVGTFWWPDAGSALELRGYGRRFASEFGLRTQADGVNLGLDHLVEGLLSDPATAGLLTVSVDLPADTGVRIISLTGPAPRYPWSAVWREDDQNRALAQFLARLTHLSRVAGWTKFDAGTDWLPEPDRTDLDR